MPNRKTRRIDRIDVRPLILAPTRGRLTAGGASFACALGRAGIVRSKREGDGGTPRASLAVRRIWRRADKVRMPASGAPATTIRRCDGWCDEAGHRRYNRLIKLPFPFSHEVMWRGDDLYDLVGELGWNDRPPVAGRGSAIFLHAARPDFSPTAGCIALAPSALARVLSLIGPGTTIHVARRPRKARPLRTARRR